MLKLCNKLHRIHRHQTRSLHISSKNSNTIIFPRNKNNASLQLQGKTQTQQKSQKPGNFQPDFTSKEGIKAILRTLAEQGEMNAALDLLNQPNIKGIRLDAITYSSLIEGCNAAQSLEFIRQVYKHIKFNYFRPYREMGNKILTLFIKLGPGDDRLEEARQVFDEMSKRSIRTWTIMMLAYAESGQYEISLKLFRKMRIFQKDLDMHLITTVLKACAGVGNDCTTVDSSALRLGMQLHSISVKLGVHDDLLLKNATLVMYSSCSHCIDEAEKLFNETRDGDRDLPFWNSGLDAYAFHGLMMLARQVFNEMPCRNIRSWTSLINGYFQVGLKEEGMLLFKEMMVEGVIFDQYLLASVLRACSRLRCLDTGLQLHSLVIKMRFDKDVTARRALLEMYTSCGCMKIARLIFDSMTEKYATTRYGRISLIEGYSRRGDLVEAAKAFENMQDKGAAEWRALVWAYVDNKMWMHGLTLFSKMNSLGLVMEEVDAVRAALVACLRLVALEQAQQIHSYLLKCGYLQDLALAKPLVRVYSDTGYIDDARLLFESLVPRDTSCWNAVILGCQRNGLAQEALQYYEKMRMFGEYPNNSSFIGVLSACSQLGSTDQALQYLESFNKIPNLELSGGVFACAIDLLSRPGKLEEAFEMIKDMHWDTASETWEALLRSCRVHSDLDFGLKALERLKELKPHSTDVFTVLAKVYEARGMLEQANGARKVVVERQTVADPAFSRIVVSHTEYLFLTGQIAHPQAQEIEAKLEEVESRMEESGCETNVDLLFHDVEEEREDNAGSHSEKLAMAIGLIGMPSESLIRIAKNRRMCPHCHEVAKFVSKFYKRYVILTDTSCVHHFKDGICSCKDYW